MTKMQMLVVILWLIPLLAWELPRLERLLRRALRGRRAAALALVALAAAWYAYPSSASKSTNPPAYGPRRAVYIRMIRNPLTGRLHPVGAPVKLPEAVRE